MKIVKYVFICSSFAAVASEPAQNNPAPQLTAQSALLLFRAKDPLMVASAAERNQERALVFLKIPGINANFKDGSGKTALHYAAEFGLENLATKLIELGADKTIKDDAGLTALAIAQANKHGTIVKALLATK